MTPALIGVIPEDFTAWRQMDVIKLPGRVVCTARRNGVTIQLVCADGWWTVTKMHKGQILVQKIVKKLPSEVAGEIERRRRDGRQHVAPRTRRRPADDADAGLLATRGEAAPPEAGGDGAGDAGRGARRAA